VLVPQHLAPNEGAAHTIRVQVDLVTVAEVEAIPMELSPIKAPTVQATQVAVQVHPAGIQPLIGQIMTLLDQEAMPTEN